MSGDKNADFCSTEIKWKLYANEAPYRSAIALVKDETLLKHLKSKYIKWVLFTFKRWIFHFFTSNFTPYLCGGIDSTYLATVSRNELLNLRLTKSVGSKSGKSSSEFQVAASLVQNFVPKVALFKLCRSRISDTSGSERFPVRCYIRYDIIWVFVKFHAILTFPTTWKYCIANVRCKMDTVCSFLKRVLYYTQTDLFAPFLRHLLPQSIFSALYKWFKFDIYWWIASFISKLNNCVTAMRYWNEFFRLQRALRKTPWNLVP